MWRNWHACLAAALVALLAVTSSACGLFSGRESPAADALEAIAADFDDAGVLTGAELEDRAVDTMCDQTPSGSHRETVFVFDGSSTDWDEFRDHYVETLEEMGWEVVGRQDDRVDLTRHQVADEYDGIAFVVRRYPPPDYALVGQVWGEIC